MSGRESTKKRERERETERQRDRETERQRDRETESKTSKERVTEPRPLETGECLCIAGTRSLWLRGFVPSTVPGPVSSITLLCVLSASQTRQAHYEIAPEMGETRVSFWGLGFGGGRALVSSQFCFWSTLCPFLVGLPHTNDQGRPCVPRRQRSGSPSESRRWGLIVPAGRARLEPEAERKEDVGSRTRCPGTRREAEKEEEKEEGGRDKTRAGRRREMPPTAPKSRQRTREKHPRASREGPATTDCARPDSGQRMPGYFDVALQAHQPVVSLRFLYIPLVLLSSTMAEHCRFLLRLTLAIYTVLCWSLAGFSLPVVPLARGFVSSSDVVVTAPIFPRRHALPWCDRRPLFTLARTAAVVSFRSVGSEGISSPFPFPPSPFTTYIVRCGICSLAKTGNLASQVQHR